MTISNKTFTVFKTTSRQLKCFGRRIYTSGEYEILDSEKIFIYSTNTTYEKTEYFKEKAASGLKTVKNIIVCQKYIPASCKSWKVLSLNHGQFKILENLSIYENSTSSLYNYGQYEALRNNSIQICISIYKMYTEHIRTINKPDTWLDHRSLLCAINYIFSCPVNHLRHIPRVKKTTGKKFNKSCNQSIDVCVFVADIKLRQPWTISKTLYCNVQHYFLLASFTSMSVISFHTCKTFARKMPALKSSRNPERILFIIHFALISLVLSSSFC